MKNNQKMFAIVGFISVFIFILLYCTYNLNKKITNYSKRIDKVFNDYSNGLISNHEFNNSRMDVFKESPEAGYRDVFENGTLTNSGRMCFKVLCNLRKNAQNEEKLNILDEKYSNTISVLYLYYSINLKKLADYKNVTNEQIDSLVNYNNEAIKIVKELQNVK